MDTFASVIIFPNLKDCVFCSLLSAVPHHCTPRYHTGDTDAVVAACVCDAWTASLPDIELPVVLCFHFPYGCSSPPASHLNHNPIITPTASELSVKNPPYVFLFFLMFSPSLLIPSFPLSLTIIPFFFSDPGGSEDFAWP